MYYNYHARNMERIKNGELIGFSFCDDKDYALILYFSTEPFSRPIRHHSVHKYEEILRGYNNGRKKNVL